MQKTALIRLALGGVMIAATLLLSGVTAWAACLQERDIECRSDFVGFGAVAWSGTDYVLAGQSKTPDGSGLALLHLSRTGEAGTPIPIPYPPGLTDPAARATVRGLVPAANGVVILLASLEVRQPAPQALGWVAAIGPKGVLWHRVLSDPQVSVVLHGAHFDPTLNRLLVVGRVTPGRDDGRCSVWSQSYVQGLDGTTGNPVAPRVLQGGTQTDPRNRQALYDIVPSDQPNQYIVAGFQTGPLQTGPQCRDGMTIGRLTGDAKAGGPWQIRDWRRFASDGGDQDAFHLLSLGKGRYLVAGAGAGPEMPVYVVDTKATDAAPPMTGLATPAGLPPADRFGLHALVPVRKTSQVLFGGSLTRGGNTFAFWQVATSNLSQAESPIVFKEPGSDLADAALAPSGQILAVGRVLDGNKTEEGWFGFVGPGTSPAVAAPTNFATALHNATPIGTLRTVEGVAQLSNGDIQGRADLSGARMRQNDSKDIAFDIATPQTIGIVAQGNDGDIDLVLNDQSRTMMGFSNTPGLGVEMLIANLQPGHYILTVLAQTAVSGFRVRIAPTKDIDIADLTALLKLSEDERVKLSDQLATAGYGPAPQPSIALGGETVLNLLAAQANSSRPFGPRGIGRSVATLSDGP